MEQLKLLTQKWLAQQVGYTPQMISMIFRGQKTPSYFQAVLLERRTGIPVNTWMSSRKDGFTDTIRREWNVYRRRVAERGQNDNQSS